MTNSFNNTEPNASTYVPPVVTAPIPQPHVWTIEQIKALPEFGAAMGWFYGLVECEGGEGVEIAEVYPGMGWTSIDSVHIKTEWSQIVADLADYRP